MTINSYLVKSTVVAALGGLLFGFDTAVIAGTTRALSETYHLSPGSLGVTVAAALWGTILGAMLAGIPGDRYGRRDSLRAMAVLYLISSLGCAFAWSWSALVFFRFIGGLGIIIRGTAYALRSGTATLREQRSVEIALALASILTPLRREHRRPTPDAPGVR